jgi:hypothetical protein
MFIIKLERNEETKLSLWRVFPYLAGTLRHSVIDGPFAEEPAAQKEAFLRNQRSAAIELPPLFRELTRKLQTLTEVELNCSLREIHELVKYVDNFYCDDADE